jgi:hypothetical protein
MMGGGLDPVGGRPGESRPSGGSVTGLTLLSGELGGSAELLKSSGSKLARVAVLYDPANPPTVREVKGFPVRRVHWG